MTPTDKHLEVIHPVVACIICGYAHGGTTFFSRVVSAHSDIAGAFECGILMADAPSDILKLPEHMLRRIRRHWGVNQNMLGMMAAQTSFREAYDTLRTSSRHVDGHARLYDKFPGYVNVLPALVNRIDVPVLVVARDPRAVYWSIFRKQLQRQEKPFGAETPVTPDNDVFDLRRFAEDYVFKHRQILDARTQRPQQVAVFQLEALVTDFAAQRRRIFAHLGLDLPAAEFGARTVPDQKVRDGLDHKVIDEYRHYLSQQTCESILELTAPASEFHVPSG